MTIIVHFRCEILVQFKALIEEKTLQWLQLVLDPLNVIQSFQHKSTTSPAYPYTLHIPNLMFEGPVLSNPIGIFH